MTRGKFLVIEGGDGAGKSTSAHLLCDTLVDLGYPTVYTREPGGTPLGESLRTFTFATKLPSDLDVCLMYSARVLHLHHMIEPTLSQGVNVVCDRYTTSTWAYQLEIPGVRKGVPSSVLHRMEDALYMSGMPMPDLEFFFSVPLDIALSRTGLRGETPDRFEATLESTSWAYAFRYSEFHPPYPVHTVDAVPSPEIIQHSLLQSILPLLQPSS